MRAQLISGLYGCEICDHEFQLQRASGEELNCPECGEPLLPIVASGDSGGNDDLS